MDNFNNVQAQPFYNSINLNEIEWAIENEKASGLQSIIRKIFEANPTTEISGWQMKNYLDLKLNKKHNILSVRRSISNLKKEDVILKTAMMRIGSEGKSEHFYVYNNGNNHVEKVMPGVGIGEISKKILETKTFTQPTLFNDNNEI